MDVRTVNPDVFRQMFGNNPALAEQMIHELPAMIEEIKNFEVQSLMHNPETRAAITQIQEGFQWFHIGLQRLHIAAPNIFQAGGLVAGLQFVSTGLASSAAAATDGSTNSPSTSSASTTSTGQTPSSTTGTPSTPSSTDPSNSARVLAQMLNMMPNQDINTPLDQHYAVQ